MNRRKCRRGEWKCILSVKWHLMVIFWVQRYLRRRAMANIVRISNATLSTQLLWDHNGMAIAALSIFLICEQSRVQAKNRSSDEPENVWFSAVRLKLKMKNGCRRFAVVIVIFLTILATSFSVFLGRRWLQFGSTSVTWNISRRVENSRQPPLNVNSYLICALKSSFLIFINRNRQIGFALSFCYSSRTNELGARLTNDLHKATLEKKQQKKKSARKYFLHIFFPYRSFLFSSTELCQKRFSIKNSSWTCLGLLMIVFMATP